MCCHSEKSLRADPATGPEIPELRVVWASAVVRETEACYAWHVCETGSRREAWSRWLEAGREADIARKKLQLALVQEAARLGLLGEEWEYLGSG